MLLSVIIPYYNADAWIGKMLDSLMDQDLDPSDYESIVVDDESSQEPATLKDYASRYPQITYHKVPHGGQALARNYGLSVAKGEWLCFADADDFLQPQVTADILHVARERDLEIIIARFVLIAENEPMPAHPRRNFTTVSDTMTGLEYMANLRIMFNWGVGTYWVKRALLQEHGLTFEDVRFAEDRLFKVELYQHVSRLATVDVDAYYYVQHESSFFHNERKQNNPVFIEGFLSFMERLVALSRNPDTPSAVAESLKQRLDRTTFFTLRDAFLYSPVQVNRALILRLEALGLYPIPHDAKDSFYIKCAKRLINHRRLWQFTHRIVHLLPDRCIHHMFHE